MRCLLGSLQYPDFGTCGHIASPYIVSKADRKSTQKNGRDSS